MLWQVKRKRGNLGSGPETWKRIYVGRIPES